MGIDFGSMAAKTAIIDEDSRMISFCVMQKGAVSEEGVAASIQGALTRAGLTNKDIAHTVSTGYGRRRLPMADKAVTEIACHARGAFYSFPKTRTVIDIGGQDSKVIGVDDHGLVTQFAMNDRCAAGTGQFLQVLAQALRVKLDRLGPLSLKAQEALEISSTCTVFAQTEVISLLAAGRSKADIIAGTHDAIARRVVGMVQRVGLHKPVTMTGGVAKNIGVRRALERLLGCELLVPSEPQVNGALGAALFALDEVKRGAGRMVPAQA